MALLLHIDEIKNWRLTLRTIGWENSLHKIESLIDSDGGFSAGRYSNGRALDGAIVTDEQDVRVTHETRSPRVQNTGLIVHFSVLGGGLSSSFLQNLRIHWMRFAMHLAVAK